jgi:hypothetical protein
MRHTWEDLVDVFRLAKMDLEIERDPTTGHIRKAQSYSSPLDAYQRKRLLQDDPKSAEASQLDRARDRYDSGMRLAQLWYYGIERSNHSQWRYEVQTGGSTKPKDPLTSSTIQFIRACKAVELPVACRVAIRVCCHNKPAGERGEMLLLKRALDDLTKHFRK